jgi:hypothetical protein
MPTRAKGAQRAGRKVHNRGARAREHEGTGTRGHVGWAWLLRPCGAGKLGPPHAMCHDNPRLGWPRTARRHRPCGRNRTPPPGRAAA